MAKKKSKKQINLIHGSLEVAEKDIYIYVLSFDKPIDVRATKFIKENEDS